MGSQAKKPTVIVLDRPRRVVTREEHRPELKTAEPEKPVGEARKKVLARLRRLHPMD